MRLRAIAVLLPLAVAVAAGPTMAAPAFAGGRALTIGAATKARPRAALPARCRANRWISHAPLLRCS